MAFFTSATELHIARLINLLLDTNNERLSTVHQLTRGLICELVKAETGLSIDNLDWTGGGGDYVTNIYDIEQELENCVVKLVCGDRLNAEEINTWRFERYKLTLYDLNAGMAESHHRLGYILWHTERVVFWCSNFGVPRTECVDSKQTVGNALLWCSLRPGDTDKEYFDNYTPAQLEWAEAHGEELGILAMELTNPDEFK